MKISQLKKLAEEDHQLIIFRAIDSFGYSEYLNRRQLRHCETEEDEKEMHRVIKKLNILCAYCVGLTSNFGTNVIKTKRPQDIAVTEEYITWYRKFKQYVNTLNNEDRKSVV